MTTTRYKGHTITRTSVTTDVHTRHRTVVRHIHTIEGPVLNAPVSRLVPSIARAKDLITHAISLAEFDAEHAA